MKPALHGHGSQGFSLLEVLVATLVVALGILGSTALQAAGFRGVATAGALTSATRSGSDMLEMIRANPGGGAVYAAAAMGDGPPEAPNCTSCAATERARLDIARWKCGFGRWRGESVCRDRFAAIAATAVLDGGVVRDADGRFVVTVSWRPDARQQASITLAARPLP